MAVKISIYHFIYILTYVISVRVARGDLPSAEELAVRQRSQLSLIKSLAMEYSNETVPSDAISKKPIPGFPFYHRYLMVTRFQISGTMYKVESNLPGSEFDPLQRVTLLNRIFAYDHKHYQIFDKNSLDLAVSQATPTVKYGASLPLLFPYRGILIDRADVTLDSLKDKDPWDQWVARVKSVSQARVNNHDCVMVEAPNENGVALVRTYFANDLDYYPICYKAVMPSGRVVDQLDVEDVKKVETGSGAVYLPMKQRVIWSSDADGQELVTFHYNVRQIDVNPPIDDTMFTVDRGIAQTYRNIDSPAQDILPSAESRLAERNSAKLAKALSSDDVVPPISNVGSARGIFNKTVAIWASLLLIALIIGGVILYAYIRVNRGRTK